ncbi:response regulator [Paenibacillus pasadenensis]|nr:MULTISPECIES: response regulator transcription factor [Paenibacillus]QGG54435.1 response regulator [Paenibacillus sp. B01]
MSAIRILLVDDHPSVGEGTKTMIEQDPDMKVTVLHSAMEALEIVKAEAFDVMLFDLNMPVISGLELTKRLMASNPEHRILIYTGYEISPNFNLLIESGVSGFVSKTASREQLLTSIRCVLRGEAIVPVQLLRQLRRRDIRLPQEHGERVLEEVSINERETEILQEVASGSSNRDIASKLLMSQRTVEYNLTRIFEKLGVRSRSEAIVEAKRLGILSASEFR